MFHHAFRSVPDRLLWFRDTDGLALFTCIARAFPELIALCVMPDHVHLLLPHADPDRRLWRVRAGYAHGLCLRTGVRGPLWAPTTAPHAVPDDKHLRRTVRYIHLNPCRSGLARDPLAWAFSTHRDCVGFTARPVVARAGDPAAFHRFVSSDGTVATAGTPLPTAPFDAVTAIRLANAVAGVHRAPLTSLYGAYPARRAYVRAAVHLGLSADDIEAHTALSRTQRWRIAQTAPDRGERVDDPVLAACVRAAADPRFVALAEDDRRRDRAWHRYAGRR